MKAKGLVLFWTNVINGLLFLALMLTGALLKFGPPASMGTFGRGRGWWLFGYHKHAYVDVHFWIAVALIAGIAFHMVLHTGYVKTASMRYLGLSGMVNWLATAPNWKRRLPQRS